MKKLKLNLAHEAGEILTKEEMRMVTGGAGSDVKQSYRCECTPPAIGAWTGNYVSREAAIASTVVWCSNKDGDCRLNTGS